MEIDTGVTIVLIVDSLIYFFVFVVSVFLAYLVVRRLNISSLFRRSSLLLRMILLIAFTGLIYTPLEFILKKLLILLHLDSLHSGFYFATEFIEGLLLLFVLALAAFALLGTED